MTAYCSLHVGMAALRPIRVDSARFMMTRGMHEFATITFTPSTTERLPLASDLPIRAVFGESPGNQREFIGYVHHLPLDTKARATESLTVGVAGPTIVMQTAGSGTRSWSGMTVPTVLTELAHRYRFSIFCDESNAVWPSLSQSPDQTDWQLFTSLAQRIGFDVLAKGTDLEVVDPVKVLTRARNLVTIDMRPTRGTAYRGEFVFGNRSPRGGMLATRKLSYPGLGMVGVETSEPLTPVLGSVQFDPPTEQRVLATALTQFEAKAILDGMAKANLFVLEAKVKVGGDARLAPGGLVNVVGTGNESDGLWYVTSVDHVIDKGEYTCDLVLGRDSVGKTRRAITGLFSTRRVPPATLLPSRKWVASWQG